jgi:hypothetical protein
MRATAVATMFALVVSTGNAFANRDGKGGGDRGGGDRGGNRSSSSDRSSGSKSFSQSGNQGSRSSSKSSGSNQSSSNVQRTFRSNKGSDDSNRSMQSPKFQGKPDQSGRKDFQVRRPSDDQVRDFLKQGNKKDNSNNPNFNRFKDRSAKDKDLVDREFNRWRNDWNSDKNNKDKSDFGKKARDNRDWSGNWKNSDRFVTADKIRGDWKKRKDRDHVFSDNWWKGNRRGNNWYFWGDYGRRYHNPYYWWSWTSGPRLGGWFGFGWPTPYYWDYGPGEYIYANNGVIYVNGRWYEPAPAFYQQSVRLVEQTPPLTADEAAKLEWMPLGVFAVTPDGLNEPNTIVQLAVTKDGVIGGTAFDQKTNAAFNIQGTVDQKTQRAVWAFTNDRDQRIMMETSIYNLTQPEATGLVQYSPTDMRTIELVRLQQPDEATSSNPSLPAPPTNQ